MWKPAEVDFLNELLKERASPKPDTDNYRLTVVDELKRSFKELQILHALNTDQRFTKESDTCDEQVRSISLQPQKNEKGLRPVRHWSRSLISAA